MVGVSLDLVEFDIRKIPQVAKNGDSFPPLKDVRGLWRMDLG